MYSRKVDDQTFEFGHEGVLYRRSFIMYDRGTQSLWVHATGECVKGRLKGKQLKFLPSVVTRWSQWKSKHPESKILEGVKSGGFMGAFTLASKKSKFGVSVGQGEQANLYPMVELAKQRVVNDTLGDRKIVVFFDATGRFATAWENRDDYQFTWDKEHSSVVDQTGRPWDMVMGKPIEDSNLRMEPLPATAWLIERWKGFYPKSHVYKSTKAKQ